MRLDEIIAALKHSGDTPKVALVTAVAHSNALAPHVFAVADKLVQGSYLLPAEANLMLFGLNVLAAARHPALLDRLIALSHLPIEALDQVFPDHTPVSLQRLVLTVWDRDPDELFRLIEHGDLESEVKWALYSVLARLTFDGRIARSRSLEFLSRLEQDRLIDDDDLTWWGWVEAVERLGLVELEPALRRLWAKPIFEHQSAVERDEVIVALHAAAANPADPSEFDADDIRPITDPVEGLSWIERRAAAMVDWNAEQGATEFPDVAKDKRLTTDELRWLAGFLESKHVPAGMMPFEMIDGLMTALVIGPEVVPLSEYLPIVWGADDNRGPDWDSTNQAQYFFDLFMKHWNAIAARRLADAQHVPYMEHFGEAPAGEQWADGFLAGIDLRADAWQPIFDDRRADQAVFPILALASDAPDEAREHLTADVRRSTLEQLPTLLQMIAAYWRSPLRRFPRREPARSTKVGRNEPCPCGSGKKFKKCCGSSTSSTLH